MIKFTLYSEENQNGLLLAQVLDESTAYILSSHYKNTYNRDQFKITVKYPRKKAEHVTGFYSI